MILFEKVYPTKVKDIKIKDDFWSKIQTLIIDKAIPYQQKVLRDEIPGIEKSHAIANFRIAAGMEEGTFYGTVFQDSDVAKWLEGAAYALSVKENKELEHCVDEMIKIIASAQEEDGYLDTYFSVKEPEHKWQNLQECHELYCAGHMMEAAAAYYNETGKEQLLHVAERLADHLERRFGVEKERGIPGHQEVEVGLMRLYKATGKEKYKKLASYFIEERGKNKDYFCEEKRRRGWDYFGMDPEDREYSQCFAPVREQREAVGHSVRAVYMYMAMADLALETKDVSLYEACRRLWDNIVYKKMYITGGIGSTAKGEAFSVDYDLPNDTAYAETCAAVAMVMFAKRMLDIEADGCYADIMEKELYNGILSGMQLDGEAFFYVNPLEVVQGISGKAYGYEHVLPKRAKWYACACCPPNVVRLMASVGTYSWTEKKGIIYSHLYMGQTAHLKQADIEVKSGMPWHGDVVYAVKSKSTDSFIFAVRIPQYAENLRVWINGEELEISDKIRKGYLYLKKEWGQQEQVHVQFDIRTKRIYSNPRVRANAGCVAFTRGPIVYCFESEKPEDVLQMYRIPCTGKINEEWRADGVLKDLLLLKIESSRLKEQEKLYSEKKAEKQFTMLTAIPYFSWGNRNAGNMRVWMVEE